ncbi:RNA polymerase sigma factor [Cohnella ginsengisoli]|uniref:RNA polymerase sigma factor n=1 Tax=Cohnella ginsengisoli TaxID=425004 RepID=A0A9X4KKT5_9BACL|nr:RNA polymerase sigma factor [Cohnella ginsengisoli]MDG0793721.1 RNA polymerase sigma factor [Cohnella ginsengisoli]
MIDSDLDVERLSASVGRYSLSLVRSKPAAEDLAQESWSRALPALRDGGGHANPEALLLRVARNAWIDGLRRDARKAKMLQETLPEEATIDRPLLSIELAPVFAALNAFLPKLQRTVFLLRDVLGYSIKETAARLGTSEGAVKAAHVRARRSLALVQGALSREEGPGLPADENERVEAHLMADAYARGRHRHARGACQRGRRACRRDNCPCRARCRTPFHGAVERGGPKHCFRRECCRKRLSEWGASRK